MLSFPAYGCRTGSGSISGSASRSLETRQEIRIPSHEGAVGPRWTGCREEKQKQTHRVEVTFRRVVRAAGGDRPLAGLQRQVRCQKAGRLEDGVLAGRFHTSLEVISSSVERRTP